MNLTENLRAFEQAPPKRWQKCEYRAPLTIDGTCVLDIPAEQTLLGTAEELQNWEYLEYHRERALSWMRIERLRFVPIWLMVGNAIVWSLGNTRITYIGGPMSAWHWGAAAGCAQHPAMLLLAFWRTPYRAMWKAGLAATAALVGTNAILFFTVPLARHHAEHTLAYWQHIRKDLDLYMDHLARQPDDRILGCDESGLPEVLEQYRQLHEAYKRLGGGSEDFEKHWSALVNLVTFLAHPNVADLRKRFQSKVPRTLKQASSRLNGKDDNCETYKKALEKQALITDLSKHKDELKGITERCKVLASKMERKFAEVCSKQLKPFSGRATNDEDLRDASLAVTAYYKVYHILPQLSAVCDAQTYDSEAIEISKSLGAPLTIYYQIVEMEWPGQLDLDFELVYLLACCHSNTWEDAEAKISGLEANTIPPAEFFDWGVAQAIQLSDEKLKSAPAAKRRGFVRGWLAEPIRLALDAFGDTLK